MAKFSPPTTWAEPVSLKEIVRNEPLHKDRLPLSGFLYDIYRRNVPRKIQLAGILKEIGDQPYKLAPNKFPYDLLLKNLPNVRQYCLWSLSGSLTVDQIEKIINTDFPGLQYFWFENHLKYKSIPEIWHCCDRRNRY